MSAPANGRDTEKVKQDMDILKGEKNVNLYLGKERILMTLVDF